MERTSTKNERNECERKKNMKRKKRFWYVPIYIRKIFLEMNLLIILYWVLLLLFETQVQTPFFLSFDMIGFEFYFF